MILKYRLNIVFSQTRLSDVYAVGNFALARSLRGTRTVKNFFGSCTLLEVLLQVPAKLFMRRI